MPQYDHTGPEGQGPRTGRGLGNCRPRNIKADSNETISENLMNDRNAINRGEAEPYYGQGRGRGRRGGGRGRGFGLGRN